jgi:ABC-2 type transport system ATP-binding protein
MTSVVEAAHLAKSFGARTAVRDLSFSVGAGEIFGIIGPNGAGKSTTLRMMVGIMEPDAGSVTVLGRKASRENRMRVGYLPEERGLYRKLSVIDCILYFASLIGIDERAATRRADTLLEMTGLLPRRGDRIESLSKGMGQIVQLVVSMVHDPELLILDEPLSGLDPRNQELVRDVLRDMKGRGRTVILSTHQMSDVEEMCDRVLMVNRGSAVLYGGLREIRTRYAERDTLLVDVDGELGEIGGVVSRRDLGGRTELVLADGATPRQVLEQIVRRGIEVRYFEAAAPSLNELFLRLVEEGHA